MLRLNRFRLVAWACVSGSLAFGAPGNVSMPRMDPVLFIDSGKPVAVYALAQPWQQKDGCLEGHGRGNELCAARSITHGDFHIKGEKPFIVSVRLKLEETDRAAAALHKQQP